MERLRFALLNAAHDGADTRRNFRREIDADLVEFDAVDGELPETFEFDGVVVTGSRASVYWDEPWIPPLVDWVGEAADRGLPVLGVCYGHQVLAEALGGRVAGMDGFEIGYNQVTCLDEGNDDRLFSGIDQTFTAFTTHGDAVVDLPPDARALAKNEFGVHAFREGRCWGVQFHPEYDTDTARDVTEGKRDRIGDDRVEAALDSITPANYEAACEAKRVFENFAAFARDVAADRDDATPAASADADAGADA